MWDFSMKQRFCFKLTLLYDLVMNAIAAMEDIFDHQHDTPSSLRTVEVRFSEVRNSFVQ